MVCRRLTHAMAAATVLVTSAVAASAGEAKYPDWSGAWERWYPENWVLDPGNGTRTAGGQPSHDQSKPWARGQEAPLTPEYEKVYKESLADQADGGEGLFFNHGVRCMPGGMPIMTIAFAPMEFVVTPNLTYILTSNQEPIRRIYTDGRDFPTDLTPNFAGYSIGRWVESTCIETNSMVAIGRESYYMSADGMLMPVRKGQHPPDSRYFKDWPR